MLIIVGEVNLIVKSNLIGLFISMYRSIFESFLVTDYVYLEILAYNSSTFYFTPSFFFSPERNAVSALFVLYFSYVMQLVNIHVAVCM